MSPETAKAYGYLPKCDVVDLSKKRPRLTETQSKKRDSEIARLAREGVSILGIARTCHCGVPTVYRVMEKNGIKR